MSIDTSNSIEGFPLQLSYQQPQLQESVDEPTHNEEETCEQDSFSLNQEQTQEKEISYLVNRNQLAGTMHISISEIFSRKEGRDERLQNILKNWTEEDSAIQENKHLEETRSSFIELCTIPKAFIILKGFHLKIAQSDQLFSQTFTERETQENDKHSSVIHNACEEGAAEQQISQIVNAHLQKQQTLENAFREKFQEQEQTAQKEYFSIIQYLHQQKELLARSKIDDFQPQNQKADIQQDQSTNSITKLDLFSNTLNGKSKTTSINSLMQLANSFKQFSNDSPDKSKSIKQRIQLCLGTQKKKIFELQIANRSTQHLFQAHTYLKKIQYNPDPFCNFIYGPKRKNAVLNVMTNVSKFTHAFKRFFRFRTDIHFPSFHKQFEAATQQRRVKDDEVIATKHSCYGKINYLFTIVKREDNKKLQFGFLRQLLRQANEMQIEKVYIPIQLIVSTQKEMKTNTEVLKEFCTILKKELQSISFDFSCTHQYLRYVQFVLPQENTRMKETYEKIKEILISILD